MVALQRYILTPIIKTILHGFQICSFIFLVLTIIIKGCNGSHYHCTGFFALLCQLFTTHSLL